MAKSPKLDVEYIAKLARLKLTPEENSRFSAQLADVLDHVKELGELDLDQVAPTFQTTGSQDVVRADEVQEERILSSEEALSNAAEKRGKFVRIPKILNE